MEVGGGGGAIKLTKLVERDDIHNDDDTTLDNPAVQQSTKPAVSAAVLPTTANYKYKRSSLTRTSQFSPRLHRDLSFTPSVQHGDTDTGETDRNNLSC